MTTSPLTSLVGTTMTGVPVGQSRRQTFVVERVDGDYLVGLLVSRKHPGDYRGRCVVEVEGAEAAGC